MSKAISRQLKEVVHKVYQFFERRKNDRTSTEYAKDINLAKTVAEATGLSQTSVKKIIKEARIMEAQGSTATFKSPRKRCHTQKNYTMVYC